MFLKKETKDIFKLNKKGISFTIIYTMIFVLVMIVLYYSLNKFKLTTERATLYQAVDSTARRVAAEQYSVSYELLEKEGEFIHYLQTEDQCEAIAKKHIADLGLTNILKVESVIFDHKEGKAVVTCQYCYKTRYIDIEHGHFKVKTYSKKDVPIVGVAYVKDVQLKE